MLHAVLVDDEPLALELLKILLEQNCPEIRVVGSAMNVKNAFETINDCKPDVVFLDIEMPGENGFDLLKKFDDIHFQIIFVTSYNKYAVNAIKFSALDYLLKPINTDELREAVAKLSNSEKKNLKDDVQALLTHYSGDNSHNNKIGIFYQGGKYFFSINDITRCEAHGKYTRVFLKNGNNVLSSKNLKEYEEFLSPYLFLRVHHSHLVNSKHISSAFLKRSGHLVMADGTQVPVSQRKKEEVISFISPKDFS